MDPFAACQQLLRELPSRNGFNALATVASAVSKVSHAGLSVAFVHAVARQLPAAELFQRDNANAKLVSEICEVR